MGMFFCDKNFFLTCAIFPLFSAHNSLTKFIFEYFFWEKGGGGGGGCGEVGWLSPNLRTNDCFTTTKYSILNFLDSDAADTSSSIGHRFNVEIRRGKFVEITLVLKGESTWRL